MRKNSFKNIKFKNYGTNFLPDGNIEFNFLAPGAKNVKLCLEIEGEFQEFEMVKKTSELYTFKTKVAQAGMSYCYKLDSGLKVPDPASRFQPFDVHSTSQLVNPQEYNWENDFEWCGVPQEELVFYELHTGTFTPEGTFKAIKEKLDYFVLMGITAIELMPVADFPGKRNWGYDGVLIYAPDNSYGTPDELKDLVKAAHQKGLAVFLDVVYNHFGPDGNYLYTYAKSTFFNDKIKTPWGDSINFQNEAVRDFFITNALYWLNEYHFDGLRFDAIHAINDNSSPDILEELSKKVKENTDSNRHIHLILENDKNETRYLEKDYSAQWNDDFHHCAHILTTGEKDGYYIDYTKEYTKKPVSYYWARILAESFAYQGEKSPYRDNSPRGEKSSHLAPQKFVNFIQNHDQIGNRAFGERISVIASEPLIRAAVCLYLLSPSIPMIFMGEEWGSETPFYFFCNFNDELAENVRIGRREEFSKFPQFSNPETIAKIPDPSDEKTFLASKLNWDEPKQIFCAKMNEYYKFLLFRRKSKIIPLINRIKTSSFEIYNDKAFSVCWNIENEGKKILTVYANLGNIQVDTKSCIKKEDIIASSKDAQVLDNKILPQETVIWVLN